MRRSATPRHPAARAIPNRSRPISDTSDDSIWARKQGHLYNRQMNPHPYRFGDQSSNSVTTHGEYVTNKNRESRLFHSGSGMSSRGEDSNGVGKHRDEMVIVSGSGNERVSHPRMLRVRVQHSRGSQTIENTVKFEDIMRETNQTYEQLTKNLEMKGLTLTSLYQMMNSGASMDDILRLLHIQEQEITTIITPITQTIDPIIWNIDQQIEEEKLENQTDWEYPESVYARGVQPMNVDDNIQQESYEPQEETNIMYDSMPPSESYEYFSDELFDDEQTTNDNARIQSVIVIPKDKDTTPHGDQYTRINHSDYFTKSPHPHYIQWDQDNRKLFSQDNDPLSLFPPKSSAKILLKDFQDTSTRWNVVSEENNSRPLTYTIIAASAIMASLAVFTLFVLVAYTIVKCTKKPTLNNYQVSDKKTVEIAA